MARRLAWRCVAVGSVLVTGCGAPSRPEPRPAPVVASKEARASDGEADAILQRSCVRCHARALPGRPAFTNVSAMGEDLSRRSLERVTDGTMPPDAPLRPPEMRALGLALCARAGLDSPTCTERYFGRIGPLIRTVAETLRTIEALSPKIPEDAEQQRAAVETIEEELRKHNLPHRSSARTDPTFVVLYTLLARERCAAVSDESARRSCEGTILKVALGTLPPPPGAEE